MQGVGVFDTLEVTQGVRPFAHLGGVEKIEFIAEVPAHGLDVVFHFGAVVVTLDPNGTGGRRAPG